MLEYTRLPMPLGGVVRRLGYQNQQPHTSPAALNVRPDDALEMRERIGTRPGIHSLYSTPLGQAINCITDVEWVTGGVLENLVLVAAAGKLYVDNRPTTVKSTEVLRAFPGPPPSYKYDSSLRAIGTQSVTLRTDQALTAASVLQKVYIAGDNTANNKVACYNPATDTLAGITESAGTQPTKCSIVANWRERLVLAEDAANPHLWYMSASGDPTNWDYSATGAGAAVSATDMVNGELGQPIRAVIPFQRSIVFGCTTAIYVLHGDPLMGGQVIRTSQRIGIVGRRAWCQDPEGNTWFLSWDGVYMIPYGALSFEPVCVSRNRLPVELTNTDYSQYEISMAYDVQHRGIHLFLSNAVNINPQPQIRPGDQIYTLINGQAQNITPYYVAEEQADAQIRAKASQSLAQNQSSHWWISRESSTAKDVAFWPVAYQYTHDPICTWELRAFTAASPTDSLVLLGSRDGNVRIHDRQYSRDDDFDIPAYIDFGPYELGKPGHDGKLLDLVPTTAAGSGTVNLAVRVGNSAEDAFNDSSAFTSYSYRTAGPQHVVKPRARGNAACLRFSGGDSNPSTAWALEEVLVRHQSAGRRRLA